MCVILPDRGITKIAETILVSAIFVLFLSGTAAYIRVKDKQLAT